MLHVVTDYINQSQSKIKAFLIEEENIKSVDTLLPKNVPSFHGSSKCHQLAWSNTNKNMLELRYFSCTSCYSNCSHYKIKDITVNIEFDKVEILTEKESPEITFSTTEKFQVGEWIIVIYDQWYLGEIKKIQNGTLSTNFLKRKGQHFSQPGKPDI